MRGHLDETVRLITLRTKKLRSALVPAPTKAGGTKQRDAELCQALPRQRTTALQVKTKALATL